MSTADYFPARLKELREAAGMTQQELAERAGFTKDGIAQWESGRRVPAWPHVLALSEALGASCEAFTEAPTSKAKAKRGRPSKAEASGKVQSTKAKRTTRRTGKQSPPSGPPTRSKG